MYKYNPRKIKADDLESRLVGTDRWDIIKDILEELAIKEGEKPKQHWMIVGPRGMGKSHLLTLLYYKVKNEPELSEIWIPVLFPEEVRLAGDLARFLERGINEVIQEVHKQQPETADNLKRQLERSRAIPVPSRADHLFSILKTLTATTGKHVIFFTENLQSILGKKFNLIDQKKLRSFLQESDALLLIGSATTIFEAIHDHSNPFYHFFHTRRLKDLSYEDVKRLVVDLLSRGTEGIDPSQVLKNEPRLKAIYTFTGGNPRMAVFLADILKSEINEEMIDIMEQILDELTPYFDAIINETPTYLQDIINSLANFEPAQSPKEIAAHLEMEQGTVRNYLKQAKDLGYVRVAFSKGNSNYYCLNEYLYRIWYQMRDTSHKEEIRWIFEILLMLYSPSGIDSELEKRASCDGLHNNYSTIITQIHAFMDANPEYCHMIAECVDLMSSVQIDHPNPIINEARLAAESKNYSKAIALYRAIIEADPANVTGHRGLAVCYFRQGRLDLSIESNKRVIELDPSIAEPWFEVGRAYLQMQNHSQSLEYLEKAYKLMPDSTAIHIELAKVLRALQRTDEAVSKIEEAIKIDPSSYPAYWNWGAILRSLKKFREGAQKFKKAIELNPLSPSGYGGWGDCLRGLKKYDDAIDKYKTALQLVPEYMDAKVAWARTLCDQNKYEEALDKFHEIEKDERSSRVSFGIAECLFELKRYEEAENVLSDYIKIHPDDYAAQLHLGYVFVNSGRHDDAIAISKKLIDSKYRVNDAIYLLTRAYNGAGNYQLSLEFFSSYPESLNYCKNKLNYVIALSKTQQYEAAATNSSDLLEMKCNCSKAMLTLADSQVNFDKSKALLSYLKYLMYTSNGLVDSSFGDIYSEKIKPLLGQYIPLSEASNSLDNVLDALLRKDLQYFALTATQSIYDSIFAVRLFMWIALIENDTEELCLLLNVFFEMYEENVKGKDFCLKSLVLSSYVLFAANIATRENVDLLLRNEGVSNRLPKRYIDVWTCLSAPDTIKSQKMATQREYQAILAQIQYRSRMSNLSTNPQCDG